MGGGGESPGTVMSSMEKEDVICQSASSPSLPSTEVPTGVNSPSEKLRSATKRRTCSLVEIAEKEDTLEQSGKQKDSGEIRRITPNPKGKKSRLDRWQDLLQNADPGLRELMEEYRENGFLVFGNVLSESVVNELLHGKSIDEDALPPARLMRRARLARHVWLGAKEMIQLHRDAGGGDCAVRAKGRFDYPLPVGVARKVETALEEKGVLHLLRSLCPKAVIRTENIMLSEPSSERQPIHTDSSWDGCSSKQPIPHYVTVLIPLTRQDKETGGTRVWPKSHASYDSKISGDKGFIDMIEPKIKVGDALIFDGLLSHCGTENKSKDRQRYFFYLAFSSRHDPNTDATGDFS